MPAIRTLFGGTLVGLFILTGCTTLPDARSPASPDEQFGHRYDETSPEGRETALIRSPEQDVDYDVYPATFDSVHVRVAGVDQRTETGYPVDVLVKGAFPDGCLELHELVQDMTPTKTEVSLSMRRTRGAICTQVVRPYRFYFTLEGMYPEGEHLITLNGREVPFQIR